MANRFWVGGGSSTSWAATANTNWATTTGGANNASVPGVSDVAIFDANSGVATSVLGASVAIQGLDCTNYAGTISHSTSVTLTLNTASVSTLILGASMTYTPATTFSIITITNTSGTADITTNGKRLAALTLNGVGGTFRLLGALRVDAVASAILTLTNGTFNANNFNVTTDVFSSTNANTRTLTMGSGTWTLGATVPTTTTIWNLATVTGLTFNVNTANIVIANNSLAGSRLFAGGGLTYNTLTISANSNNAVVAIAQANTFANLVVGAGNSLNLPNSTTTTITNAPTFTGTQASPILLHSGVAGASSASTLSVASGSVTLTWGGLRDVTGSGGATFVATNTLDFGNNSGWSIAKPADATLAAPTAAQVATAVWTDTTAGDFTTALSVGKSVMNGVALGTGLTVNSLTNLPAITADWLTAAGTAADFGAEVAAAVWRDAVAGDFTAANSVGKSVMNGVALGTGLTVNAVTGLTASDVGSIKTKTDFLPSATAGAAGGVFIAGTNAATTITTGLTTHLIGTVDTVTTTATATNLTNAPTNGDLTAAMKASVTAAVPTAAVNAAAVWAYLCEGTLTALNLIRVIAAACAGKASGLATATAVYRAADDSKARITATVDVDGNRTAVTLDGD